MTIENPSTIDLVTQHEEKGYVALIMVEDRGWPDPATSVRHLQEKLNVYLSYALEGQLHQDYPDLRTSKVRIQLDTVYQPPPEVMIAIERASGACSQYGIDFVLNQL